ncbi:MAG: biopolymer transporter ExbD [Gammaproteobacteria bacterium]
MHFARRRKEDLTLNLTPLIDVVFLLLIFFMVTTTFTKESRLTLELPEASGEPGSNPSEMIEVTVSTTGEFAVNGRQLSNTKLETVKRAINEAAKMDTTLPMVITADANAPHHAVVTVMDAAGQAGFVHLSITTQQPAAP